MIKTAALLLALAAPVRAADPELGVFTLGSARFTVVAPECVRIEYSTAGRFLDAPTAFARDRGARFTGYSVELSTSRLVLDTGRLRLSYAPDGWPLSVANLKAEIRGSGATQFWTPERDREPLLEGGFGVLSRAGWSLVNDSSGGRTDWYLFAYGRDYKAGLRALASLKGTQPGPALDPGLGAGWPAGLRDKLSPYLLSAARQSRAEGLPLRRPLYVELPGEEQAYHHPRQAFIGESLLEVSTGAAAWLPEGRWFDLSSGEEAGGPAELLAAKGVRLFARGGAPLALRASAKAPEVLVLRVYPGPEGVTRRVELRGVDSAAEVSSLRQGDRTRVQSQSLSGMPAPRLSAVELGGPAVQRALFEGRDLAVKYSPKERLSRISLPARPAKEGFTLYVWQ